MSQFSIKSSILMVFTFVITIIVGTIMYFQYKSSNDFAVLTTQKVFNRLGDKVINKIEQYDENSQNFLLLSKNINGASSLPTLTKQHTLLPVITEYIKNANYVYGIYLGYKTNQFYIVYNLNLSQKMRQAQKAPEDARWLIKKNIYTNGTLISYKNFVDENFKSIKRLEESTSYKPKQRPWYKKAIKNTTLVKTNPYIFSSVKEPGITYAQLIDKKNGVVLSLDITLSSLSKLLASQNLVKGSAAFIFKKDGTVIGQFDQIRQKDIKNVTKSYKNIFIENGKIVDLEKQVTIEIDGKKYIKYTTLLKSNFNTEDYLTILSPFDTIMKPYREKIYETLGITALILLVIILPIVFYAVKLIVKPILQLQKENEKIAKGEYDDIQHISSFMVEIDSLSKSLQSMANSVEESHRTLENKVQERTKDLNKAKKEVEAIHKHTRESIEYASMIQGALLPDPNLLNNYFSDSFVHWLPKDTVGGDIWLFNDLRHEDECLLMFIDCTGHGVPGAFVTMIVKAIERESVAKINDDKDMDVSPAWIMSYFNKTMKILLKQETKDSKSNAGWDGGIIYYNKKDNILKFAGAETPLFYMDVNGGFHTVKGNRYSVGYKKCDMNYEYKESIITIEKGMKFYCTTDGYLDQNGGEKDFPFGKKRFGNIIKEYHDKPMSELKEIFINSMNQYEIMIENNDRNDDMTVIGFEV